MNGLVAVVVGVGAEKGLGAALCRRFASAGYHVVVAGRTQAKLDRVVQSIIAAGGRGEPAMVDATRQEDIRELFKRAASVGDIDLVVANAGNNRRIDFLETEAAEFEAFLRVGCLSGFLVGREAALHMLPLGRGTILFTGASASLRGRPGFAHFAAAKAGLRMVAQSMAREFGPKGIHVAHVIIDGGINGERLEMMAPDLIAKRGEEAFLAIEPLAEAYWQLHVQQRSAWTQELDVRPFGETF